MVIFSFLSLPIVEIY